MLSQNNLLHYDILIDHDIPLEYKRIPTKTNVTKYYTMNVERYDNKTCKQITNCLFNDSGIQSYNIHHVNIINYFHLYILLARVHYEI